MWINIINIIYYSDVSVNVRLSYIQHIHLMFNGNETFTFYNINEQSPKSVKLSWQLYTIKRKKYNTLENKAKLETFWKDLRNDHNDCDNHLTTANLINKIEVLLKKKRVWFVKRWNVWRVS